MKFNITNKDEDKEIDEIEKLTKAVLNIKVEDRLLNKFNGKLPELSAKSIEESPAYEDFGNPEDDFKSKNAINLNESFRVTNQFGDTVNPFNNFKCFRGYVHDSVSIKSEVKPQVYEFKNYTEEEWNAIRGDKNKSLFVCKREDTNQDISIREIFRILDNNGNKECEYNEILKEIKNDFPSLELEWKNHNLKITWTKGILKDKSVVTNINTSTLDRIKTNLSEIIEEEDELKEIIKSVIVKSLKF